jgi:hypothetical protein
VLAGQPQSFLAVAGAHYLVSRLGQRSLRRQSEEFTVLNQQDFHRRIVPSRTTARIPTMRYVLDHVEAGSAARVGV